MADEFAVPDSQTSAPPNSGPLSALDLGVPNALAQVLGPSPQLPQAPPMPGAPPSVSQDPRQRLLMLATLGLMMGAGQRSGVAQGAASGLLGAQGQLQQALNQRFQLHQQEAQKQQALLAEQQRKAADEYQQRDKSLMGYLATIKNRVGAIRSKAQYDQEIEGYAQMLKGAGYRLDSNWLRQAVPFVAPDMEKRAEQALNNFLKNPMNKALLEKQPDQLMKANVPFDIDGDGIPEQVPYTRLMALAHQPVAMDPVTNQPMVQPKGTTFEDKASADGIFQTLLAQAKAEGKNPDDPQVRLALQTKALQTAKQASADPLAEELRRTQLNQQPTEDDAKVIAQQLVAHKMAPSQLQLFGGFGTAGQAFKRKVLLEAQKLDPGFDMEEAESTYTLAKSPQFQQTIRYMQSVTESMPRLLASARQLNNGRIRSLNALVNAGNHQINNVDLKRFQTDVLGVSDEVAKILQGGGTGSGTSDAKLRQAQSILSTSDSPAAIATALEELSALIGYRQTALTRGTYLERQAPAAAPPRYLSTDPNAGQPLRGAHAPTR